jgi:hypothetical protein
MNEQSGFNFLALNHGIYPELRKIVLISYQSPSSSCPPDSNHRAIDSYLKISLWLKLQTLRN